MQGRSARRVSGQKELERGRATHIGDAETESDSSVRGYELEKDGEDVEVGLVVLVVDSGSFYDADEPEGETCKKTRSTVSEERREM